jgi:hypothetical protein
MSTIVSLGDPELAKYANSRKVDLGSGLEPNVKSHKSLWKGLSELAQELINKKPKNNSVDEISKSYQQQLDALEKQIEKGEVTAEEADQARADLKKDAQDKVDLAQNIYFKKMSQALPYFKEAIDAFKEGAILEITNVDNEEAKADNIKSESNYTNYLEQATNSAIRILYKNKS